MTHLSPYFNFEERIDESERKIRFEAARYSKLVENKVYYQSVMPASEFKSLMDSAARRLVLFDPNFDTSPLSYNPAIQL